MVVITRGLDDVRDISTIHKGAAGETLVQYGLILMGADVYLPVTANTDVDLICEYKGELIKIQIKSYIRVEDKIHVDIRRPVVKTGRKFTDDSIRGFDILAVVDIIGREVAYFSPIDIPSERFTLFFSKEMANRQNGYKGMIFQDYHNFDRAVGLLDMRKGA